MSVMRAAAQPTRVKIINMLLERDQMTHEEIMRELRQQHAELLDKHLEVLTNIRFLTASRQNNSVSYQLQHSKIGAIQQFMSAIH